MSKASGFALLLAGLGVASYVVAFDAPEAKSPYLADIPGPALVAEPRVTIMQSASEVQRSEAQPAKVAQAQAVVTEPKAPVIITLPRRASEAAVPASKGTPAPRDAVSVARELQRELKRVGCYEGEINGLWTPGSRAAMKAFTDRVNAKLPIESPDNILLSLVQMQQGRICGRPCPAGEGLAENDRCVPNGILAHAAKKPAVAEMPAPAHPAPRAATAAAITGWSTTTSAAPAASGMPPEGRMALAGPATEPRTSPLPPVAASPPPSERFRGPTRDSQDRRPRQYVERAPSRGNDVKSLFSRLDAGRW